MRKFYPSALMVVFFCMWAFVARADIFSDIAAAIRTGNAHAVAQYFDANVEMMTAAKSNVYSRNQAELVLNEFFSKNQPRIFNFIHRGSSVKGAQYAIGVLETSQGSFRVYIYVNEVAGKSYIQEIRFEKP